MAEATAPAAMDAEELAGASTVASTGASTDAGREGETRPKRPWPTREDQVVLGVSRPWTLKGLSCHVNNAVEVSALLHRVDLLEVDWLEISVYHHANCAIDLNVRMRTSSSLSSTPP